jgi:GNAT superfamily N-acetyltransferase
LANAWVAFGREYEALDPAQFVVRDTDGLDSWFEERPQLDEGRALWLVAVLDDQVAGFIRAQIWDPDQGAARQLMREAQERTLKIDSLMVLDSERRSGVATALMGAAERWGIDRGASRAVVVASLAHSPAVSFYESRMGYERRSLGFAKTLGPSGSVEPTVAS